MDRTRMSTTLWTLMKHACQNDFSFNKCHQTLGGLSVVHCYHGYNNTSRSCTQSHPLPKMQKEHCAVHVHGCSTHLLNIQNDSKRWLQYRYCHTHVLNRQCCSSVFKNYVRQRHLGIRCYRRVNSENRVKSPHSKQTNVLVDRDWAKKIVSVMNEHFQVSHPDTVIFDSNAGKYVLCVDVGEITEVCLVWKIYAMAYQYRTK